MNKTVRVKFTEQSKAVTSETLIEYSGDNCPSNEEILKECSILSDQALKESAMKTLRKV